MADKQSDPSDLSNMLLNPSCSSGTSGPNDQTITDASSILASVEDKAASADLQKAISLPQPPAPKVIPSSISSAKLPLSNIPPEVGSSPADSSDTIMPGPNGKPVITSPKKLEEDLKKIHAPQPAQPYTSPAQSFLSRAYSLPRNYKIAGGVAAAVLIIAGTAAITRHFSKSEPHVKYSFPSDSRKVAKESKASLEQKASQEPKAQAQPQTPAEKYLSGTLVSKLSTISKTGLEKIILHGESLFQARNQYRQEDEEEFILYPESSILRVTDENDKTEVEPKEIIIPTLAYNSEGKPATSIDLTTEGPYGLKVNIAEQASTKGITAKVVKDDDIPRKLDLTTITVKVAGKSTSYFIPAAEKPSKDCRAFYFVPTKRTKRVTYPNGSLTLTNEKGIYEPKVVSAKEYAKRAELKVQQAPQVNHTTGRGALR